MANILPLDTACAQAMDAQERYKAAIYAYRQRKSKTNLRKLKDAYSKLSSAQWEVEQHEPLSQD